MKWLVLIPLFITVFETNVVLSAEPTFHTAPIFPAQGKHTHGSSLVECPNGDLLACWYHGSGERNANDVVIQGARLKRDTRAWSEPFLMADTPNLPDCNPVLFVDRQKRLWLFWVVVRANRWERSILKYRVAHDYAGNGAPNWSWQDIIILKPGKNFAENLRKGFRELQVDDGVWGEYALPFQKLIVAAAEDPVKRQVGWMTRIHPVQLPSGRILVPLYSDGFVQCLMAVSDDDGKTWNASRPIVGLGASQPTIVQLKSGQLKTFHRDDGALPKRAQSSTSDDGGLTWSVARDTDIPNPGSSLEVIVLTDGRWAMAFNDTERGRHRFAVAVSDDEGQTWKWKRHIERARRGEGGFSYPSLIQASDGHLHVTYSHKRTGEGATIQHAAFNVEWVTKAK
ncbi:Sialidase precursor [Symmachiella macrocystis]|uniref:Sialidase n=1 Tax=Symmachiella macrocystis TaxID=2527985 RepID=A0A5C6BAD5_9PLAN|nr:sialidase family protein [Symmachiella macrocystis]TWU08612.1 Sialidase precursor [Symmachiella macrocystis]